MGIQVTSHGRILPGEIQVLLDPPVRPGRDGDHPAGGALPQQVQQEVGEQEVAQVVDAEDETEVVFSCRGSVRQSAQTCKRKQNLRLGFPSITHAHGSLSGWFVCEASSMLSHQSSKHALTYPCRDEVFLIRRHKQYERIKDDGGK